MASPDLEQEKCCRPMIKAGNWTAVEEKLLDSTAEMIKKAESHNVDVSKAKAVILPHDRHYLSGDVAATFFKTFDGSSIERIILFGVTHFTSPTDAKPCMICPFDHVNVGNGLKYEVDCEARDDLISKHGDLFSILPKDLDMNEHSLELIISFLPHSLKTENCKVLPLYVSSRIKKEMEYEKAFEKHLLDPKTLFIISSDFCHYGENFKYHPFGLEESYEELCNKIEEMDMEGIGLIKKCDYDAFEAYLQEKKNTICGRNTTKLWLSIINKLSHQDKFNVNLLKYDQSERIAMRANSRDDGIFHNVSYATIAFCYN